MNTCALCTVPLHPHENDTCDPCTWAIADERNHEWWTDYEGDTQ